MFEYIIVGAGFAGSVMAERIANILNKKVLVIEKRDHIGGNCYDYCDKTGILVHKYGPHIFHTDLDHVWEYLSSFTDWHHYEHKVLGFVNKDKIPIPFNLNSLHRSFSSSVAQSIEQKLIETYGYGVKIPILKLMRSEDEDLRLLADYVYNNVFLNYTKKQWGMKPEDLDPSVTERVPLYISHDNRYFQDRYQGVPKDGYNKLFVRMLNNPNINLKMNTDSRELINIKDNEIFFKDMKFKGVLIFTGSIDELFDYKFGKLPYRSLNFEFQTINQNTYQEVGTVNYPNNFNFTRITEFKHLTGQKNPKTSIVKEYPKFFDKKSDIPYYPIPKIEYNKIYKKYAENVDNIDNLILVGRLADYKYFNMDSVIERTLTIFEEKIR